MLVSSDYLPFNTIVLSFTDSSFNHHFFYCLLADLNTACFSFSGSTVLPPATQLFKKCLEVLMSLLSRILQTQSVLFCLTIFLVQESTLIFSKIMFIQSLIVEMKSERCQFCKSILFYFIIFFNSNFFGQRPNTRHSIHVVL